MEERSAKLEIARAILIVCLPILGLGEDHLQNRVILQSAVLWLSQETVRLSY